MKFYAAVLIIFALTLGFGFFTIDSLSQSAENITENFSEIVHAINEENWQKAAEEFSITKEKWHNSKIWWAMIIDHQEIDNIDVSFARTDEYLKHQDQVLSAGEISVLQQFLEHIPETEKISWKNIF